MLRATIAAGALLGGYGGFARAQTTIPPSSGPCTVSGTSATCGGDVSAGISASNPLTSLTVNDTSATIAPASTVTGVAFNSTGSVSLNITGGSFGIAASGANARGIFGSSSGGDVSITSSGNIATTGSDGHGIYGQNSSGNISVTTSSAISTTGFRGKGIYARGQSAAAGSSISVTASGSITTSGNTNAFGIQADADSISQANVTVNSTADITTTGSQATGIYARAQNNSQNASISVTSSGAIKLTGNYSDGIVVTNSTNAGGPVAMSVTSSGSISVSGTYADGIVMTHTNAGYGDATLVNTGDITVAGSSANGIVMFNRNDAGISNNTVTSSGNVVATGTNSHGVQVGGFTAGSVSTVNLTGGTVQGGSGTGAGVRFASSFSSATGAGTSAILNNSASVSAFSGTAISSNDADVTINNSGNITGSVSLGSGTNAFNNKSGGTFNAGATVNIGTTNTLTNAGTLNPGGSGTVQTSALTGVLNQTSGTLEVDINSTAGTSDQLTVSGAAALAGAVSVNVTSVPTSTQQFTVLSAAGGATDNGLTIANNSALTATLLYPNANDVVLEVSGADFAASSAGLNTNQTSIGAALNDLTDSGAVSLVQTALLNVSGDDDYAAAIDQLSPEAHLTAVSSSQLASLEFQTNLLSCRDLDADYAMISEDDCYWLRPEGRVRDRDSDGDAVGFHEHVLSISAGGQAKTDGNLVLGGGVGFERGAFETDSDGNGNHQRLQFGGAIKYPRGPLLLSGTVAAGVSWHETRRNVTIGTLVAEPEAEYLAGYVAARLRAAYAFVMDGYYLKPLAEMTLSHVRREGFTEAGGGETNLTVQAEAQTFFSIAPGVELGGAIEDVHDFDLYPYLRAGLKVQANAVSSATAQFAAASDGAGSFTVETRNDRVSGDIEAGIILRHGDGDSTLNLAYEGNVGATTRSHGGYAKIAIRF